MTMTKMIDVLIVCSVLISCGMIMFTGNVLSTEDGSVLTALFLAGPAGIATGESLRRMVG